MEYPARLLSSCQPSNWNHIVDLNGLLFYQVDQEHGALNPAGNGEVPAVGSPGHRTIS
jgi:hypothetical protein